MHIDHHAYVDEEDDPHAPTIPTFSRSFIGYIEPTIDTKFVKMMAGRALQSGLEPIEHIRCHEVHLISAYGLIYYAWHTALVAVHLHWTTHFPEWTEESSSTGAVIGTL
jgi:fatty-acid desaturase